MELGAGQQDPAGTVCGGAVFCYGVMDPFVSHLEQRKSAETWVRWKHDGSEIQGDIFSVWDVIIDSTRLSLLVSSWTHWDVGNGWHDGGKTKALLQFVFGLKANFISGAKAQPVTAESFLSIT